MSKVFSSSLGNELGPSFEHEFPLPNDVLRQVYLKLT